MNVGHYISGAMHVGVLAWLAVAGVFTPEPLDIKTVEVSVLTSDEFDALMRPFEAPVVSDDMVLPEIPAAPEDTPPQAPAQDSSVETQVVTPPPVADIEAPVPPAPVDPIEIIAPEVTEDAPVLATPSEDIPQTLPTLDPDTGPIDADRVAPRPAARPDTLLPVGPETQAPELDAQAPDTSAKVEVTPSAPEAATTQIITEAVETGTGAPNTSLRPKARPVRPDPVQAEVAEEEPVQTETDEPTGPATDPVSDALQQTDILAALGEALAEPELPAQSPPLSANEIGGLISAISNCWNVNVGAEAANIAVTVYFQLTETGRVVPNSVTFVDSSDGNSLAAQAAFQAAQRAIFGCQAEGYQLPIEKYDQWAEIELTFDPKDMRTR